MTFEPNGPIYPPEGAPPLLSDEEQRQRNLLIGLVIGAVIILLAGVIAFAATRGGGQASDVTTTVLVESSVAESVVATSTTSTTTSTTTTSTTIVPIVANADAGVDLVVDRLSEFTLTASNLASGTPDAAVRWTQTAGPDATSGAGKLSGALAVAVAPSDVSTLVFELTVAGTDGVSTDEVVVRVFEDADQAVFVDGERGDDAADGALLTPFRTLTHAVGAAFGRDVYVRSVGTYDTTTSALVLPAGVSLYGGFDADWNRDVTERAVVSGADTAITVEGPSERWISAIEVTSADAANDDPSIAIAMSDIDIVHIEDSRVVAGDGGDATASQNGGLSIGIRAENGNDVRIERTTVNSSRAGDGRSGSGAAPDADGTAPNGSDAVGREAGPAAPGTGPAAGGAGGRGGQTSDGATAPGGGGVGGTVGQRNGGVGPGGSGGAGGVGGDGGVGLIGAIIVTPVGADGSAGAAGALGVGGRGGGGGFGPLAVNGGGGAGGGVGGLGGESALGGGGAGGSVGIWAIGVNRLTIIESLVASGRGGIGGAGFAAGLGQSGGAGGLGALGVEGLLADGGNGGGGGGGGAGGRGGAGGGGAGGPSYGMLTTNVNTVEVSSSTVRAGGGGNGGPGGIGGRAGGVGADGSGRGGGIGGGPAGGADSSAAQRGVGASGGSSYGWFDETGATQLLDTAEFIEGNAGAGGPGSTPGDNGVEISSNV